MVSKQCTSHVHIVMCVILVSALPTECLTYNHYLVNHLSKQPHIVYTHKDNQHTIICYYHIISNVEIISVLLLSILFLCLPVFPVFLCEWFEEPPLNFLLHLSLLLCQWSQNSIHIGVHHYTVSLILTGVAVTCGSRVYMLKQ